MKKSILTIGLFSLAFAIQAQVGIGTDTPDPSAILEIVAEDKGVLIPRVELNDLGHQLNTNPNAEGLLIYNLTSDSNEDLEPGFFYWHDNNWRPLGGGDSGGLTPGNNNTVLITDYNGSVVWAPGDVVLGNYFGSSDIIELVKTTTVPTTNESEKWHFVVVPGTANQILTTDANGDVAWADAAGIEGPWFIQGTTDAAIDNTDDIYQIGKVAIGKTVSEYPEGNALLDVAGAVRFGNASTDHKVGLSSIASGKNSFAISNYGIALGEEAEASNHYSTAIGYKPKVSGLGGTAIGYNVLSSGNYATAFGGNTTASSLGAFAVGVNSSASATYAIAMGLEASATNHHAIAIGREAKANQLGAVSLGYQTTAKQLYSVALGYNTITSTYAETALGSFNKTATVSFANQWREEHPLFQIGNGVDDANRSNALTMLKSGKTSLGMSASGDVTPTEQLDVIVGNVRVRELPNQAGDATDKVVVVDSDGVLKTIDAIGGGTSADSPWNKQGTTDAATNNADDAYLLGKVAIGKDEGIAPLDVSGAIRGGANQNHNSNLGVGDHSIAVGNGLVASGSGSAAFGVQNHATAQAASSIGAQNLASGFESFAQGYGTEASGQSSVAMGEDSKATGNISTTLGTNTVASGFASLATGQTTKAIGTTAFSGGYLSEAQGNNSVAMVRAKAKGDNSIAMGYVTEAKGMNSVALGERLTAGSFSETVIGRYNKIITGSETTWLGTDALFQVGNGTSGNSRSNALTILKDGWVGIGTTEKFGNEKLRVDGAIRTAIVNYPDYVFEDYFDGFSDLNTTYKFKSLSEIKDFITTNRHLPGVPSIESLNRTKDGLYEFNLTELSTLSLEKIEELYLHTIEQEEKINELEQRLERLESLLLRK